MLDGRTMDWTMVAIVAAAFLLVPAVIVLNSPVLPFRVAYLVLPLGPALLLAAIAVWYALRRGDRRYRSPPRRVDPNP